MMMKTSNEKSEITKKELNRVFWRSFQMEFSWNYERQMNLAYVYAMIPILKKIQENGLMESLTYGAAIIGLMVVGGMTATMIDINIPLQIGSGENAVTVQSIFDDIVPKILSLGAFGAVFYLLKKEVKPLIILLGLAVVGILGSLIGLF